MANKVIIILFVSTTDDEETEEEGIVLLDSPGIIPAGQLDQRGERECV